MTWFQDITASVLSLIPGLHWVDNYRNHEMKPYIVYELAAPQFDPNGFSCQLDTSSLGALTLIFQKTNDRVLLRVEFNDLSESDRDLVRKKTRTLVEEVIRALVIFFDLPIPSPVERDFGFPETFEPVEYQFKNGIHKIHIHDRVTLSCSVTGRLERVLLEKERDKFTDFLSRTMFNVDYLWLEYTAAVQCSDPVGKYMLLYNILLQLCGDSQDAVDRAIISLEPSTQLCKKPSFSGRRSPKVKDETVYTKVRNQVCHQRQGVTLDAAKQDVVVNVGKLVSITKRLVNKNVDPNR